MSRKFKVGIIGNGRMGRAAAYYFTHSALVKKVCFIDSERETGSCDLLVGALAGGIGRRCLELAIKYRKNLVDLSDVDPPEYLKKESRIIKAGITVIPGCGFSPGLTNFVLGRELATLSKGSSVEIKAGSLSRQAHYYPFLWCFEDIVVEHTIDSYQLIDGAKKRFPVFAGYKKEKFLGIDSESYLCASGFENILDKAGVKNCFCRVVRPAGFMHFFRFLENYGLLRKGAITQTKEMLERRQEDNYTFAEINVTGGYRSVAWVMRTFSRRGERLNSMQKITAAVPAVVGEMLFKGGIRQKGLLFMEELAKLPAIFDALVSGVRAKGVTITRKES